MNKRIRTSLSSPVCIEAFSGAGGMALGLRQAGFDVRLAFDIDKKAVETYNNNIGPHGFVIDARHVRGKELLKKANLGFGELDILSGGPPCQGFSKQRRGAHLTNDGRNGLVLEFARLVQETGPRTFLFENVAIFGQKRGREFIEAIKKTLPNYTVNSFFICSSDFGLAQTRGRFLMIGIRNDFSTKTPVVETSVPKITVRDVIGDLPPPPDDYTEHPQYANHLKCRISKINEERFSHVPPGGGWQDIPMPLRLSCHQTTDTTKGGWPDVYGRLDWEGQCPTITAGFDSFTRGRYGHPEQNRSLTLREGARLQGFPDKFRFYGNRYDVRVQIGNAVPPPVARKAGEAIMRVLENTDELPKRCVWPEDYPRQIPLAI